MSGARRSALLRSFEGRPWLVRGLDAGIATLIVLNIASTILETVAAVEHRWGPALRAFNLFSVAVFSVEYLLRLFLAPKHPSGAYGHPWRGRLRFALTPMALIDLLAILPFYLGLMTTIDLRFLRCLRLFRIFKLTRYSAAMTILLGVLREESKSFAAALFILVVVLIFASSGIYLVEHDEQPEAFGSIPAAMWWAVATLTTVGYGDVTPITVAGKLFGALVTVVGIGMVALPAGILSSAFADHLRRRREVFQEEVAHALEDGRLSRREKESLREKSSDLGISVEDADRLVARTRQDLAPERCPHCGERIASP